MERYSLDIANLRAFYACGELTPHRLLDSLLERMAGENAHRVWIHRLPEQTLRGCADALAGKDANALPLYGIPFAIKDNIDLAGVPTTAACPEFAYVPQQSAFVVQRLIDAGAIPLGKTNLDQFATGLNGTRSPYGACRNSFNPEYIAGGSSSGSAVAVALGLASFSLGTDTAGSGRVPAAFNNLIGHKPTRGWISARGVVPACRSLDTVSIFALTASDAEAVLAVAADFDAADAYACAVEPHGYDFGRSAGFRFGVPHSGQLEFFGNAEAAHLFRDSVARLEQLGGRAVEIDFAYFLEAARLLYDGPWVAERYAAVGKFCEAHREAVHAAVREIVLGAKKHSAADAFLGAYRLQQLKRETEAIWRTIDCLLTPTAGTIYTIAEMLADPITLNAHLGYYTNFMNLLDCAAVAVPAGFQANGLPFGVTLAAPAQQDAPLLHLAARMQQALDAPLGATTVALPAARVAHPQLPSAQVRLAVCGAHLSGQPLNHQLTTRGARMMARTATAAEYKLYALRGGPPQRPGLVRAGQGGAAIEVEVWEMPLTKFGSFVAGIPAPLGIATLALADGEQVLGFVCEHHAVADALDITHFGGWRAYTAFQDKERS